MHWQFCWAVFSRPLLTSLFFLYLSVQHFLFGSQFHSCILSSIEYLRVSFLCSFTFIEPQNIEEKKHWFSSMLFQIGYISINFVHSIEIYIYMCRLISPKKNISISTDDLTFRCNIFVDNLHAYIKIPTTCLLYTRNGLLFLFFVVVCQHKTFVCNFKEAQSFDRLLYPTENQSTINN